MLFSKRMTSEILIAYGLHPDHCTLQQLGNGLINKTWKVIQGDRQFVLQRINDYVFKEPFALAENISLLDEYLRVKSSAYLFVASLKSKDGKEIVKNSDGYFRLFPFIKGSHTIQTVSTADQAYEASGQFGRFTQLLSGFDSTKMNATIPDFHNLSLRHHQLEHALMNGNQERIKESKQLLDDVKNFHFVLESFEKIRDAQQIRTRVTHHDTKISNVLFDDHDKGMCVIDLDTVMPGYFISDLGDMMRTYLSPATEEERSFEKINVRDDIFMAVVQGYVSFMKDELSEEEQGLIFYSGLFLIYMQAIRFLTDYLNNDAYYGADYEGHNFIRAGNQLCLLKRYHEKKEVFQQIISNELKRKHTLYE